MCDLCVIIVSYNDKDWLEAALSSLFDHAGQLDLDVVVVDNGDDGSAEFVAERFQRVRTIRCPNHGFGHANNRGLEAAHARYVLFLNPDTEMLEGTLQGLIVKLDARPKVAIAGVRQLYGDGTLAPSIRRFPSIPNMLAEALGIEKLPGARNMFGERQLNPQRYDREGPCDWTSGSFMLVRSAALDAIGGFDERFFLFSEETDLCWRIRQANWQIVHIPSFTIRHEAGGTGASARMEAQNAYSRMQFARKHFSRQKAAVFRALLAVRYALRVGFYDAFRRHEENRRRAARAGLSTVLNSRPPFGLAVEPEHVPNASHRRPVAER